MCEVQIIIALLIPLWSSAQPPMGGKRPFMTQVELVYWRLIEKQGNYVLCDQVEEHRINCAM